MKAIYEKALEMLKPELIKYTGAGNIEREIKLSKKNFRTEYNGFEFVFNESGEGYDRFIKVMKKDIGFTFKVRKIDSEDLRRMQYVYDITVACNNNSLLLPLAKKVTPKFDKINKKYPGKITRNEYKNLDIHSKDDVISLINKILL